MAAAAALLILSLALIDGMVWDMIESATEMYVGHASITAEDYRKERTLQLTLPEDSPPLDVLEGPGIKGYSGRVRGFLLLSYGEGSSAHTQPAELLGVDPAQEVRVTRLAECVKEGRFLDGPDGGAILLGAGLAKRLEAEVGGELVVMGQAADGSIAADLLRVGGVLDTGDAGRDSTLAVVGRRRLQTILSLEGRVHEWAASLERVKDADLWVRAAEPRLRGMDVESWLTLLPQLGQMLDFIVVNHLFMGLVFYFAAVLVTVNTMYMALIERMREFAVMGAIGLRPIRMAALIVLEGFLLGVVSALIGGVVGGGASLYFQARPYDLSGVLGRMSMVGTVLQPRLRAVPDFGNVFIPVVTLVVVSVLVSFWPAWKLLRLRPVEILREV